MSEAVFDVSGAIAVLNQSLEQIFPTMTIVGEVASFKVNQGKWVFFDLKDDDGSLGCFMSLYSLRTPIEDGMMIKIVARPKITNWGKFSLTVEQIQPVGEGSLKKAFELLRAKLAGEGLFAPERKRLLPELPSRIGVVSSTDAAGYKDFIKILGARFGGLKIEVYHTLVQGLDAPEQIMQGIEHFNEMARPPEVIALVRGGGSADDLAAFNDEPLVRKIAASRVPIVTGIGHEVDTTLSDLAADVRASTPSNAAEILLPDKRELMAGLDASLKHLIVKTENQLNAAERRVDDTLSSLLNRLNLAAEKTENQLKGLTTLLEQLNPERILRRGYALVYDANGQVVCEADVGDNLRIETNKMLIETEVKNVKSK
ncbi:MAG: exodeoxyribonuclease VII large subunit [Candidatus Nomurabacteria bacterium]|jgi:exodeoxyribonuclease VII large subunit|nr:exodeoxyribonuclease VII large subunit [Candidatus Nomurabacteria bacterium]